MGGLPADVIEFIEQMFAVRDRNAVRELIDSSDCTTPRVMRAALHLSGGSVGLLEHYLKQSREDVRAVLLEAEYALGIGDEPLRLRDLSKPFGTENDERRPPRSGSAALPSSAARARKPTAPRNHHAALARRRFKLGDITYVVMSDQPCESHVRCFRIEDAVTSMVRLPVDFVLEQLAEHIEIVDTFGTA